MGGLIAPLFIMKPTRENIEKVANELVERMDTGELCQYVYEDLYDLMLHNEDVFDMNVESLDWYDNPPE